MSEHVHRAGLKHRVFQRLGDKTAPAAQLWGCYKRKGCEGNGGIKDVGGSPGINGQFIGSYGMSMRHCRTRLFN